MARLDKFDFSIEELAKMLALTNAIKAHLIGKLSSISIESDDILITQRFYICEDLKQDIKELFSSLKQTIE